MINKKNYRKAELERLQNMYPLFTFTEEHDGLRVSAKNSSLWVKCNDFGIIPHEAEIRLNNEHMVKSLNRAFRNQYPDLYISVYANKDGITLSVWVNRNDDDAEAIGCIDIVSPKLRETLSEWQKEAAQSKVDGWFFCSGHLRAEPKTKYGFFYFASRYCKQFGIENPKIAKEAALERYN